jgi:hypothetical protein
MTNNRFVIYLAIAALAYLYYNSFKTRTAMPVRAINTVAGDFTAGIPTYGAPIDYIPKGYTT